jgi:hypothetical protein
MGQKLLSVHVVRSYLKLVPKAAVTMIDVAAPSPCWPLVGCMVPREGGLGSDLVICFIEVYAAQNYDLSGSATAQPVFTYNSYNSYQ